MKCVGCERPIESHHRLHSCVFYKTGFTLNETVFRPCHNRYHAGCIRVGAPFTSRLVKHTRGMEYPPRMYSFPFICEACTVRAVLGRELHNKSSNIELLALERMRSIDMAHAWADSTMDGISRHLRHLKIFENKHAISICPFPPLSHPPCSPMIPLLWTVSAKTLQLSSSKRKSHLPDATVTYNSARQLQSAAAAFYAWSQVLRFPESMFVTPDRRIMGAPHLSPSDTLYTTYTNKGMKKRLGIASTPSIALQSRHIEFNLDFRLRQLHGLPPTAHLQRYELIAATFAELSAWGGWLRASEVFNLRHKDISTCEPEDHLRFGFPPGVGAVFYKLSPETKSSPFLTADVVLSDTFASGLSPLFWWKLLKTEAAALSWDDPDAFVFRHASGVPWTSSYFRYTHLYPLLRLQQQMGDPLLAPFNDEPGNTIEDKIYSFHTYRRGGRSHVSRKRALCVRKARPEEVSEHGRWRTRSSSSPDMPTHYREWTIEDRIYITLLCM